MSLSNRSGTDVEMEALGAEQSFLGFYGGGGVVVVVPLPLLPISIGGGEEGKAKERGNREEVNV